MPQVIGVPKEVFPGEKRVATVPEVVPKLAKLGFSVIVESGAGDAANCADETYVAAGAEIAPDAKTLWSRRRHRLQGARPEPRRGFPHPRGHDARELHLARAESPSCMEALAARKATVLAIDALPRMLAAPRRWTRSRRWPASAATAR